METLESLYGRRSVRKFTAEGVPESSVQKLLKAAMHAPSAMNQQPWHFVVIDDRDLLNQIADIQGGYLQMKNAPMAILVCGEEGLAKLPQYWTQDCAAATENILVAAQPLGLGAVWCGLYPTMEFVTKFREILNIPDSVTPFSLIGIGYPAESPEPVDRFREDRIKHNAGWTQ